MFSSLRIIVGNVNQVMVYGWGYCSYKAVFSACINHPDSFFKMVYDDGLGSSDESKTLEGHKIEKLPIFPSGNLISRTCKTGITNLLLENYKRNKENRYIIPVIFCIDCDENEYPSTAKTISSKEFYLNKLHTHSELRRTYKMQRELINSPDKELREMGQIANHMFKFVKVINQADNGIVFQEVPALWTSPDIDQALQQRAAMRRDKIADLKSTGRDYLINPTSGQWRFQLLSAAKEYNTTGYRHISCWSRFVRTSTSIRAWCVACLCFRHNIKKLT